MKQISVIGAGLAGLYAAKEAAINGLEVIVYEHKKELGKNLKCGEMFTCIYGRPPEKCITRDIEQWCFDFSMISPELEPITVDLPEGFAVMTDRATHEKILQKECEELGVEFVFGCNAGVFDSGINIAATGAGLWKGKSAIASVMTAQCDENHSYIAYFKVLPNNEGYVWAFPKTDNEMNIGIGYEQSWSGKKYCIYDSIKDVSSFYYDYSCGISERLLWGGGRIPINTDYKSPYNYSDSHHIFVGDGAGLVNPMLCGGAHLAMLSGQLAGYICANNNNVSEIKEKYIRAIIEIISPEMELGIFVHNMRKILPPVEFYEFFKSIAECRFDFVNLVRYIKRVLPQHIKVPQVTNDELKGLL